MLFRSGSRSLAYRSAGLGELPPVTPFAQATHVSLRSHIKNVFNSNKEVKISRDGSSFPPSSFSPRKLTRDTGTELEPAAGELLIEEFWRGEEGLSTKPVVDAPPPQQAVPSGLVES